MKSNDRQLIKRRNRQFCLCIAKMTLDIGEDGGDQWIVLYFLRDTTCISVPGEMRESNAIVSLDVNLYAMFVTPLNC